MEENTAANQPKVDIIVPTDQQSKESTINSSVPSSGKKLATNKGRRFKNWLKKFSAPTPFCTAIIMFCTIAYTGIMWVYTSYTYRLLAATEEANRNNQKNFREGQKPSVYISNVFVYPPTDKRKYHRVVYTIANAGNSLARITSVRTMTNIESGSQKNYGYPNFPPIIYQHRELPIFHMLRFATIHFFSAKW